MTVDAPRITLATPPRRPLSAIAGALPGALATGLVACVRLDMPGAQEDEMRRAIDTLRPICHGADVALIISEHFRLVRPLGLDGVEMAGLATPLRKVREEIGGDRILGVACSASRHAGMTAAEAGADYIAFGPVARAGALGSGEIAPRELFEWWSEVIETPVTAEGGVGLAEAAALGAVVDFIAPDAAIWDGDVAQGLRAYAKALESAG